MNYTSINKETYNNIADQFSGTRDYLWEDLKALEPYVRSNTTVIDIGCGNGRLYQLFAKSQCFYVGVDQSEGLIKMAKQKFSDAQFLLQEMSQLDLADDTYDQAWLMASFHHLSDQKTRVETLLKIKKSLKQNGEIIMLNWNMSGEWVQNKVAKGSYTKVGEKGYIVPWRDGSKHNYGDRFYYDFSIKEIEELAKEVGLEVVDQYYIKMGEREDVSLADNLVSILKRTA